MNPVGSAHGAALRTLRERCAAIELLVVDVDGVLTDGGIVHGTGGLELKRFHVRDGFGLRAWQQAGKRSSLITGRSSPVVEVRAREVGIEFVFQGAADKWPAYGRLLEQTGLAPEAVCYVGDDLPDLPPLRHCGLAVAVADACPEVRAAAHHVTQKPGGAGAVREVVELVLRCQGHWQTLVEGLDK
jgi:3-deoxy-D-manno-octulosonate 8-phosphate phosphatase (KDO 8-P phosphatase)